MAHITTAKLSRIRGISLLVVCLVFWFVLSASSALAATLSITPDTGVYTTGDTVTARVIVNTQGQSINAADGTISFNPSELSVVSVSSAGSIFGLWAEEPSVQGNQIVFSGGAPSGYSGTAGTIMTVTFRVSAAGTKRLSWQGGSVLAADGRGTNILSNMNGASYTVRAQESSPEPEVMEYVPPANTPAAPTITSDTHPDSNGWYSETTATLSWNLPSGVTQVRTLLNQNPNSVPSRVYENPIRTITLDDLPNGVSYFHIQFRNADGWGTIGRYRLAVSTERPSGVTVALSESADLTSPVQDVLITVTDSIAPISEALLQINGQDPVRFELAGATSTITLPELEPGYHTIVAEIFDAAGNSDITTLSFTIASFDRPIFTDVPDQITESVIPVFRGQTRPNASVTVSLRTVANDTVRTYEVVADSSGIFQVIPENTLPTGVYELTARAVDEHGAKSEVSDTYRFAVQQPGYIRIGNLVLDFVSILVPLIAMLVLLVLFGWYIVYRIRRLRRRVLRESSEAHQILTAEFTAIRETIERHEEKLRSARKNKHLTKAEEALLDELQTQLRESEQRVAKEIVDVEDLIPHKHDDV